MIVCIERFALLALVGTGLSVAYGQQAPVATVHVDIFGPFGEKIQKAKVHIYKPDRKRDFAGSFSNGVVSDVPYGQYMLVVIAGNSVAERELAVNTKEMWIRVGMPFPGGERQWPPGDLTISGDISPPPSRDADWWVRVEGIFLNERREAPVLPSGHFSVRGLWVGAYLVEIFDGLKLEHIESTDIDTHKRKTRLKIELSDGLLRK